MNFESSPGLTFEAYMNGLFEPDAPELAFYKRHCRRGHFRYFIARREDRYLADWIFLLAMPCFELCVSESVI